MGSRHRALKGLVPAVTAYTCNSRNCHCPPLVLPESFLSTPATFDSREFRSALGMFATGVTIVTTLDAGQQPIGVTANSFNSVSLDPPMVLWSLAKSSRSLPAFQAATHWNVHILAEDQEALSNRFARAGEDKFADLALDSSPDSPPLLPGCSARFECRTAFQYEGGDHMILVGEVLRYHCSERPPLLYVRGGYATARHRPRPTPLEGPFTDSLLGYLVSRLHFRFLEGLHSVLAQQALTFTEFFLLSVLAAHHPLNANELAEQLAPTGMDVGPVLLSTLQQRGLIFRHLTESGPAYQLTPHGNDAFLHVLAVIKSLESEIMAPLPPADRGKLFEYLRRMLPSLDPA